MSFNKYNKINNNKDNNFNKFFITLQTNNYSKTFKL